MIIWWRTAGGVGGPLAIANEGTYTTATDLGIDVAAVGDIDLRPASIRAWLVAGAPAAGELLVPATPH